MTERRGPSFRSPTLAVLALACATAATVSFAGSPPRQESKEREREESEQAPDHIGPALAKRIRGEARLDDVRVDVEWPLSGKLTSARVYGHGVGIWDRRAQFRLSHDQVIAILKALQKARFGQMPKHFGEEEEGEEKEGPRLKGRVTVGAGAVSKSVLQLADGEQSEEFAALAQKLLAACEGPARKGVVAASLTDGLEKVASRVLAPEALQGVVQRRFDRPEEDGETGWIVRLDGRAIVDESLRSGSAAPVRRRLVLPESEFLALVGRIVASKAAEIPKNVYATEYTDVQLAVLRWQNLIAGRRYLSMSPETHGPAQKSFDGLYEAFRDLHRRAREAPRMEEAKDEKD